MIAPEEIGAALQYAVRSSYGIDVNGAVTEASRLFGFKRVGKDIQTRFKVVLRDLVTAGVLQERGGQLHAAKPRGITITGGITVMTRQEYGRRAQRMTRADRAC